LRKNIKAIKYIILLLALLLLTVLLIYTQPQKDLIPLLQEQYIQTVGTLYNEDPAIEDKNENDSLKDATVNDIDQTIMQEPSYLGEDVNKKLWSLKATSAIQNGNISQGFTEMFNVVAKTLSIKDVKVDYSAKEGTFISKENKVILKDDVVIKSKNLELKTDSLEYELDNAYAESNSAVKIKTEIGNIVADSLKSYDNGSRLFLEGNVRAKLYNIKKD
jgi:LPS export ABC transporter protein LptC